MKARAFALMLFAVLLCAVALTMTVSGTDNCCSVDRQCHSDRDWVDGYYAFQNNQCSAPAPSQPASNAPAQIDNCCFVDRQCHSDLDWIGGYHAYQNNQCAAPAQTQTVASSQPTGAAPAQIDNCCFVDRQCHTDQEWINGYHAYRTNQCGAPSSSQPTGGASAQVDNCCFLDRQCQTVQDYWVEGYHAFQNNQCGAPGQLVLSVDQADNKRRALRIETSARFIAAVNAALDLLKARAPHWYVYTVFGYDWILEVPKGTIVSTHPDVKLHLLETDKFEIFLRGGTGGTVGYLVHVAAHNYQQQRYLAGAGLAQWIELLEDEREALTVQIEAMEACCPGHPWLPGLRHKLANIDKLEYQWWHQ